MERAKKIGAMPGFDVAAVRADFPALDQKVHGKPLTFLDSAASALKPRPMLEAMTDFYAHDYSNIHRAVHTLSQRSTEAFEAARKTVAGFLRAGSESQIIFTRGTTEAINLVAQAWGRPRLGPEDEIVITGLEHHSNIVPWQLLCEQTGARLVVVPIDQRGDVPLSAFQERVTKRTRLIACAHVSNALGTVLSVKEIAALAKEVGALSLFDGAQAVPHVPIDVATLGCDFYAFSAHKLYGPSGIGVLYGKRAILEEMAPYQGGGDMIRSVSFEKTTYNDVPHKFEAGTPHIAGAVGLARAIEYFESVRKRGLEAHEAELLRYAEDALRKVPGLTLIGTAPKKVAVASFTLAGVHPHDIGTILDREGIAVRTGHHCAQPVMTTFNIPATVRASLGMYNQTSDIDALVSGLEKVKEFFP
jgi:cysteine desulfurase/selenocysteine lyase